MRYSPGSWKIVRLARESKESGTVSGSSMSAMVARSMVHALATADMS